MKTAAIIVAVIVVIFGGYKIATNFHHPVVQAQPVVTSNGS
jgi:hypothetical protein